MELYWLVIKTGYRPLFSPLRGSWAPVPALLDPSSAISGGQSDPPLMLQVCFPDQQMLTQRLAHGAFF